MTTLTAPAVSSAMGIPTNMPDVIDALKRLERIGSENSKTVEKIIEAAKELSTTIVKAYAPGENERILINSTPAQFARYAIVYGDLCFVDRSDAPVFQNRELALRFSNDIANGLLDRIAEDMEKRQTQNATALATLQLGNKGERVIRVEAHKK